VTSAEDQTYQDGADSNTWTGTADYPIVQLGHCRADHPERLDHDWPIGIDVLRAVEIDRIDAAARYKFLPIDDL
jgi:hypothetical protein